MDGRLLTFKPKGAVDEDREERVADAASVIKVLSYVMVVVALNAAVLAYMSYQSLDTLELVPVPGPDNTTLSEVREGPMNALAALGLGYYITLVVAVPSIAIGLARRRRWAFTPTLVASVVSMGAFPVGTFIAPSVVYLLTRPAQREAMGLPPMRQRRPKPYGDETPPSKRP
jgi:hypothetical protein